MLAIGIACTNAIRDTARIRNHMLGTWVAENVLTKMQLGEINASSADLSAPHHIQMDGRSWYWSATTGTAAFTHFVPITVGVALSSQSDPIVRHTADVVTS